MMPVGVGGSVPAGAAGAAPSTVTPIVAAAIPKEEKAQVYCFNLTTNAFSCSLTVIHCSFRNLPIGRRQIEVI